MMSNRPGPWCATRALKNAYYLQSRFPDVLPSREPQAGFASIIPFDQLCRLHLPGAMASLPPELRSQLQRSPMPSIATTAQTALFSGTVYVVSVAFTIGSSVRSASEVTVPLADIQTAIAYLTGACVPISAYAKAYGDNSLRVSDATLNYSVTLAAPSYNDATLKSWVNDIAAQNALDVNSSCIIVLNPQGVTNTDADATQGILGYHGIGNLPYCFINVMGQGFTMKDESDYYAWALSHEVAEMTVDPSANLANPEVCDPCGPNCPPSWRAFFGTGYLQTSVNFPPAFDYSFFINAIVKPASASQCPAPAADCNYAP